MRLCDMGIGRERKNGKRVWVHKSSGAGFLLLLSRTGLPACGKGGEEDLGSGCIISAFRNGIILRCAKFGA